MGGYSGALWPLHDLREPLNPLAQGGATTKIHALVDARGRPVLLKLTEDLAHDGRSAANMYGSVGTGQTLLAPFHSLQANHCRATDRAYDSDGLRVSLAARGAVANIRLLATRKRFPAFDVELYQERNQIERFFSKLKNFRAIATRYDKRDDNFLASVQLASSGFGCEHMSR